MIHNVTETSPSPPPQSNHQLLPSLPPFRVTLIPLSEIDTPKVGHQNCRLLWIKVSVKQPIIIVVVTVKANNSWDAQWPG